MFSSFFLVVDAQEEVSERSAFVASDEDAGAFVCEHVTEEGAHLFGDGWLEDVGEKGDVDRVHLGGEANDLVEVFVCGQFDPHGVSPKISLT